MKTIIPLIKRIIGIMVLLCFFMNCYSQRKQNFPDKYIYGNWKFVKYWGWTVVDYSKEQLNKIKASILHVEKNKVFFEGLSFIPDTCHYDRIEFKSFFDRDMEEPNVFEDRDMAIHYTKKTLSTIRRIELNCQPLKCDFSILYLKQDTLITNYCGGYTLFWMKIH